MPPTFRSTSVAMKNGADNQREASRWALPGSVAAHVLVVILLIFGLPLPFLETEEEKPIAVDLVPPKSPEEKKAGPPPPPEEPKKPEEKKVEKPPESNETQKPAPQPVLRPVYQFGEKDAGPRMSPDGNAAEEGSASSQAEREPAKPEPEKQTPSKPPALAAAQSEDQAALPEVTKPPTPKPAELAKKQNPGKPGESRRLFSQKATGDVIATTAMADLPRGVRGGRLCVTELREQLQNGLPPYYPDLLPSSPLEEDATAIDVPEAAFRVSGQWYDLSYRCEVDTNATRVLAFTYRVGAPLPPSEWRRRGLPSQ